jgi:hypothetical protein
VKQLAVRVTQELADALDACVSRMQAKLGPNPEFHMQRADALRQILERVLLGRRRAARPASRL